MLNLKLCTADCISVYWGKIGPPIAQAIPEQAFQIQEDLIAGKLSVLLVFSGDVLLELLFIRLLKQRLQITALSGRDKRRWGLLTLNWLLAFANGEKNLVFEEPFAEGWKFLGTSQTAGNPPLTTETELKTVLRSMQAQLE